MEYSVNGKVNEGCRAKGYLLPSGQVEASEALAEYRDM